MAEISFPFGPATQAEIYVGSADDLPLDPEEWEARANHLVANTDVTFFMRRQGGLLRHLTRCRRATRVNDGAPPATRVPATQEPDGTAHIGGLLAGRASRPG